ncbi:hypothetical protein EVAR_45847_1 [Eumeta japonica]|uniref:Uncharacterized protein n=1 Tax=Eumeta variegata TaxID=151549 RepID=A0A4C1WKM9_EUMVA|nr:hypothetical protein EVAR_45847_1 [Eumeta japonica]
MRFWSFFLTFWRKSRVRTTGAWRRRNAGDRSAVHRIDNSADSGAGDVRRPRNLSQAILEARVGLRHARCLCYGKLPVRILTHDAVITPDAIRCTARSGAAGPAQTTRDEVAPGGFPVISLDVL